MPICTATAEIVLTLERRRDGQWNVCALKPGKSTIGNTPTPCRLHLCPEKVFTCGSPVLLHCIVGGGGGDDAGGGGGDGGDGGGGTRGKHARPPPIKLKNACRLANVRLGRLLF